MEQRVTPYLMYENGEAALEWLARAFGFREVTRTTGGAGGLHAELQVHDDGTRIFLGSPPQNGFRNPAAVGSTSGVYVIVDGDVDAHCARARDAGATIVEEPNDLPFGHRRYTCTDPQGHEWYFAMPVGAQ